VTPVRAVGVRRGDPVQHVCSDFGKAYDAHSRGLPPFENHEGMGQPAAQENYALDNAFALIEGQPIFTNARKRCANPARPVTLDLPIEFDLRRVQLMFPVH